MLGCSSLLPSETAFLIQSLFQFQKYLPSRDGWLLHLRSFFFSSRVNFDCYVYTLNYNNETFCNNNKKTHRIRSLLHFTPFNKRCVSSVLFQLFFFTSLMKESMITVRFAGYYINSACALLLVAEVTHSFFFHLIYRSHFSHPNLTNCNLQNTRMLTDTDHSRVQCSPIDSGITHNFKKTRDPK